jgi:hypothetical protein
VYNIGTWIEKNNIIYILIVRKFRGSEGEKINEL